MTSASGFLPLTIPKTRAEAGLRRGSREFRARKFRELRGLRAAQCETSSQLALGTGTKRGQSHICPASVVLGSSTLDLWMQRESEYMAEGRSPSFPSYLKVCCTATTSSPKGQKQLSWTPPQKTKSVFNDFFRHDRHSSSLSAHTSGDNAGHERGLRRLGPSLLILQRAMQRKDSVW